MNRMKDVVTAIVLSLLLGCAVSTAFAQPTVTGVSGQFSAGGRVTVSGAAFGTKAVAGPLVWDNFESGTSGSAIAGKAPAAENMPGSWTWAEWGSHSEEPLYSNQQNRPNSARNSMHTFNTAYTTSLEIEYARPNTGDEVYFTFYYFLDKTSSEWTRNHKPWIAYGNVESMPMAYDGWGNPTQGDGSFRNSSQDNGATLCDNTLWGGPQIDEIEGQWIRLEGYLKVSAPSQSNGAFQVWTHDGSISQAHGSTSYKTRCSNNHWLWWHFGSYYSDADANVHLDDLYFDNTRARVEIGNTASWSTNSRREIQIPRTWSSGSIEVTVNPGTFSTGQTAYIYVVDSQGRANAVGFPVVVGGGVVAPMPPSGLQVN
jgi:hypothetical protein